MTYEHPDVILCPGGPMLVRDHPDSSRPVAAVCRCEKSASFPWCDGTHKVLPPDLRPA
jgi:CDGSH-type Zn-finger protein